MAGRIALGRRSGLPRRRVGLSNTVAALVGLMMMGASLIVWWRFYRCPYCHEQLGRGNPKRCPKCGAWIADEPEPEEKKKIQHKKKKH